MIEKYQEKQDAEKIFPWCSSERITPTLCHRLCSLIHPSLHFPYLPSSSGPRCKAAEVAHSYVPRRQQRAAGLPECFAPSPIAGPTHFIDIIQDSLLFQHVQPRYCQHLLQARTPWPFDSHFPFLFGIICYIYYSSWLFKFKILLRTWCLYMQSIISPWMWKYQDDQKKG